MNVIPPSRSSAVSNRNSRRCSTPPDRPPPNDTYATEFGSSVVTKFCVERRTPRNAASTLSAGAIVRSGNAHDGGVSVRFGSGETASRVATQRANTPGRHPHGRHAGSGSSRCAAALQVDTPRNHSLRGHRPRRSRSRKIVKEADPADIGDSVRFGRHLTASAVPSPGRETNRSRADRAGGGRVAEASLRIRKCPVQLVDGLLYQLAEIVRYI
jgi:hypothetical protein